MANVTIAMTEDQQQILINILSAVNNNRRIQRGSNLRESFVFDLDQNDIDTMTFFTDEANWKQTIQQAVIQNNQSGYNINGQNIIVNSDSSRLISLLEAKDVQIAEKDKQIDRLLKMIESLNN